MAWHPIGEKPLAEPHNDYTNVNLQPVTIDSCQGLMVHTQQACPQINNDLATKL